MTNYRYNSFLLIRMLWGNLRYADWRRASSRLLGLGLIVEFFASLSGLNGWAFFIEAKPGISKSMVQELLLDKGVVLWGWGYNNGRFMFRVKKRQAYWAEYLLLRAGLPLSGVILSHKNPLTADQIDAYERRSAPRPQPAPAPRAPITNMPVPSPARPAPRNSDELIGNWVTDIQKSADRLMDKLQG